MPVDVSKPAGRKPRCPICGKLTVAEHVPFCSVRCADADLSRWLGGEYRIPTDERPGPAAPDPSDED
jgi:endogenous inhibitor of DNA gyrase (YacG/DUF329 family)